MEARSVADYDGVSVPLADAKVYVEAAERFVDRIASLLPSAVVIVTPRPSTKATAEANILRSLAVAFSMAAEACGETLPPDLIDKLVIYGTRDSLTQLIADINKMNDLVSFPVERFPNVRF
jgi:hypothetical protein